MDKYLFNDGTNVIREVQSREELDSLIQSTSNRDRIRIWVFNSSEWLSLAAFSKQTVVAATPVKKQTGREKKAAVPVATSKKAGMSWLQKSLIAVAATGLIFLVYNFTKLRWIKLPELTISADRPENTPPLNMDSLIQVLELTRGQKLDKVTRTNLRIRNTWPERILVQLTSARDSSKEDIRYHHLQLSIDNATGYQLDETVVDVLVWKNGEKIAKDTLHFGNMSYAAPAKRILDREYRGDSLSVIISLVKAKSFNFCYSADKQSNYGNLNDRWFCK